MKKLSSFIVILMMFSAITESVNAQKGKDKKPPKGCNGPYFCSCSYKDYGCGTDLCCIHYCYIQCGFLAAKDTSVTDPSVTGIPSNNISQSTIISFQLENAENVSLKIFDATGILIKTLNDTQLEQGFHQLAWNAKDENGNKVSTGIYLLQFVAGNKSEIKKLSVTN